MATLLLVDDHPLFLDGFAQMVHNHRPEWTFQTASSASEMRCALSNGTSIDLVIIDITLPDSDGFRLCAEARETYRTPCILISGRNDAGAYIRAKAGGARGLIVKSQSPDAILGLIDRALCGEHVAPLLGVEIPTLSPRQADVLELLAEGHGNKEIRHRLGIAERTVRAHLTELFQLLSVHSRTQAIIRARELGLIA